MKDSIRLVTGLLLAVAGAALFVIQPSASPTASAQTPTGTYSADWSASKVFAIYTNDQYVQYPNSSSRDWFAVGPAEWKVDFYTGTGSGRTLMARETWTTPDFTCYRVDASCRPGGANAGSYLWGIMSEYGMGPFRNMTVEKMSPVDARLFNTSNVNPRYQGPSTAPETSQSDNTDGFYSPGAYGWVAGNFENTGGRQRTAASGMMLPLKWTVTGELFN